MDRLNDIEDKILSVKYKSYNDDHETLEILIHIWNIRDREVVRGLYDYFYFNNDISHKKTSISDNIFYYINEYRDGPIPML